MRLIFVTALAAGLIAMAPAARADVKSGVDAWNEGDYARAVAEWRPLAAAGNADAQFNLGQAYKLGRGVAVDLPVALEWFRKASDQGHEKAIDNYGLLLFQQGRREEAMPFIRISAQRNEPRAQYVYGTALFNGDLAPRDWVRAYALMMRASQAGVQQAKTSLAQMDQFVPEEQRKQGQELAAAMARGEAPSLADTTPVAPRPSSAKPAVASAPARPAAQAAAPAIVAQDGPQARPPVRKRGPQPVAPVQTAAAAPAASPPPAALPAPPASGRYRVQLGAFRVDGRAQALWKSLSGRVAGLSAYQPNYVVTSGLTRLLVGPVGSSADGQKLCARIKTTGTPCVVQLW